MTRGRRLLATVVAVAVAGAGVLLSTGVLSGASDDAAVDASAQPQGGVHTVAQDRKPNVITIQTDDQWLESVRVMPNVQRYFAQQGTAFEQYHPATPLCCPSRSEYLSGQFAHNNGVRHNAAPQGGYDKLDDKNTLPMCMQQAGYATSHVGKYPNGYGTQDPHEVPPGWTEWRGSVDPSTYQMYGYTLNENGNLNTDGKFDKPNPRFYQTDVYRDKAVDFINRKSTEGKPFFLDLAFLAPHSEKVKKDGHGTQKAGAAQEENGLKPQVAPGPRPAPRHQDAFQNEPLPPMPSYNEHDRSDKPPFMQQYPNIGEQATQRITDSYQDRLASLLAVDDAVGKLMQTLHKTGQADNTYVMFVSDNGFFFGQYAIPTGKFLPHDTSGHVPMLLRGPGIPAGRTSEELTTNVDITKTIAEIGRAEPTLDVDGRSLLPFAQNPELRTSRPILQEAADGALPTPVTDPNVPAPADDQTIGRSAAAGDLDQDGVAAPAATKKTDGGAPGQPLSAAYESIRTDRYLFIRYTKEGSGDGTGAAELYDLHKDPDELQSVHDAPQYTGVRAFLEQQLNIVQGCQAAACRAEIPPAPQPPE